MEGLRAAPRRSPALGAAAAQPGLSRAELSTVRPPEACPASASADHLAFRQPPAGPGPPGGQSCSPLSSQGSSETLNGADKRRSLREALASVGGKTKPRLFPAPGYESTNS